MPTATATALVWAAPAPAQVAAAVRAAGLPLLSMEATDVHFHAHLDIIVDGQQVAVPAEVGIAGQSAISSMHTHDSTGIIHIESPTDATFTLGQFFTEWQIPLSATCVNEGFWRRSCGPRRGALLPYEDRVLAGHGAIFNNSCRICAVSWWTGCTRPTAGW